ncbi:hypothetical protein M8C21_030256 [Ambrosia artemisiifolia]|uniref:RIN4 pathogenic type III effector avirulence factor Avr cleavage site domain-containing protein n=1 Tax=Ambrosia artemisiifolia TaxID=4212 RepID=A0AAD5G6V2_AMBAR|nr:hypothetical protein M8C21_030256 [Ambrosia artemisiifolia]
MFVRFIYKRKRRSPHASPTYTYNEENGRPLPKFGDWDVNDPASAEGFTVIFNKARDEKKTGGKPDSPSNADPSVKHAATPVKKPPASVTRFDFEQLTKLDPSKVTLCLYDSQHKEEMVLLHASTSCRILTWLLARPAGALLLAWPGLTRSNYLDSV